MTIKTNTKFDKFLKENFKYHNELAVILGVCPAAISNWRRGRAMPSTKHIKIINLLSKGEIDANYWHFEFLKK